MSRLNRSIFMRAWLDQMKSADQRCLLCGDRCGHRRIFLGRYVGANPKLAPVDGKRLK